MVRRTITLGERTFAVSPMTLGTVRRVPEAFQIAASIDPDKPTMPTPEQFTAMIAVLWDGINTATPDSITRDDFDAFVNELDLVDGIKEMAEAIKTMTKMKKSSEPSSDSAGNSLSSESKS